MYVKKPNFKALKLSIFLIFVVIIFVLVNDKKIAKN